MWRIDKILTFPQGPKQWRVPRKEQRVPQGTAPTIEPGDAGIWATCDMHKEGKCTAELRDIFSEVSGCFCWLETLQEQGFRALKF